MNNHYEIFVDCIDNDIKECANLLAKLDYEECCSNPSYIKTHDNAEKYAEDNYYSYIKTAAKCKAIFSKSIKDSHQNTILAIKAICDKFTS